MNFKRKGQAALEFLTTYGWAFLVILVMVGALSYFGVFDASKFVPESCKLDGNLECGSYALYNNGLHIEIKNNLMDPVYIKKIRIKERSQDNWTDLKITNPSNGIFIAKGKSVDLPRLNATPQGTMPFSIFNESKKTFELEVYYNRGDSTIQNVAQGTMTAMVRTD